MSKFWTREDIAYLIDSYGRVQNETIAVHLNRTIRAISIKASRLCLGPCKRYVDSRNVEKKLRDTITRCMTSREICKKFGITKDKFYRAVEKHNIPFKHFVSDSSRLVRNGVIVPGKIIKWKQNGEKRPAVHHIDGNPENNSEKNLIKIPQGLHFVSHQVARHHSKLLLPSIAFIGKAGVGKTTWATNLISNSVDLFDIPFKNVSFANHVKRIAIEEFEMENKDRRLLQIIGRVGRALDPFLWVKFSLEDMIGNITVDDCRFVNEFLVLKLLGFKTFFLKCADDVRIGRIESPSGLFDVSETELEQLEYYSDFTVDTTGSKKDTKKIIYGYIARVMLDEPGGDEKGVENAGTEEYNYAEISHGRPERT